jgi:hypothetical protein
MKATNRMTVTLGLLALVTLIGCGGGSSPFGIGNLGSGNNSGQTGGNTRAAVKVDINWAARSRAVTASPSAFSAVFTLKGAKVGGGDFVFTVDRADAPGAYTQTVVSQDQAVVGSWNMTVQFYAAKGGQGAVVGTGSKAITLNADGTGIGDVAATPTIASTSVVLPNQSLTVGQSAALSFTALDANGKAVVVTPGSAFFTVTAGGDKLQVSQDGTAKALAAGTATVTVTLDGKTSAPQSIDILASLASFEAPTPGKSVTDASTALTTHLSSIVATIPSAATILQVAGQVGTTGAFAAQTKGYLDLANKAAPVKTGSGIYSWTETVNGLTITVTLDESQAQSAQWSVVLNGTLGSLTLNNVTYVAGSYKRDSLNGKAGYHETVTFNDITGSSKVLATEDVYLFDDGTAHAGLNFQGVYVVNWDFRADQSWYFVEYQTTNGTQQKQAEALYNIDGTGWAKAYCSDNSLESELTFTNFGGNGTITEHASACGGTEGNHSSW